MPNGKQVQSYECNLLNHNRLIKFLQNNRSDTLVDMIGIDLMIVIVDYLSDFIVYNPLVCPAVLQYHESCSLLFT